MNQYLLSTYAVEGEVQGGPGTPEEMQTFMERVVALEAEMDASGTFVFGGALHGPDAATVMRESEGGAAMTDGPFVESKEHIAGFYIINADGPILPPQARNELDSQEVDGPEGYLKVRKLALIHAHAVRLPSETPLVYG